MAFPRTEYSRVSGTESSGIENLEVTLVQGTAVIRAKFRRNSWGVAAIQGWHTRAVQQETRKQSRDFILLELMGINGIGHAGHC